MIPVSRASISIPSVATFGSWHQGRAIGLYCFSVADNGVPKVFRYDLDQESIESVMSLIRSETVLKVIQGFEVQFTNESVVKISTSVGQFSHRVQLGRSWPG